MMGYIILGAFIFLVVSCAASFFGGLRLGRRQMQSEYEEEARRKAQDEKDYQKAKQDIKQEAFGNAEKEKAKLSGGDSGRERFDNINSSLRGGSPR
ncbi:MAG: hypothetical protein LBJ31_04325 [Treponema sp.]|jgi:hypothetical protein|nr:hypothetical protein [Treponema sp.]